MLCGCFLHKGHRGVGCVSGDILCMYSCRRGDLFVLSWASVRLMCLGRASSELCILGACWFSTLLFLLLSR